VTLPPITDASSARSAIDELAARLAAEGVGRFRNPPPEPVGCCGRGCSGCVWGSYFDAVVGWCSDAAMLLSHRPSR